tara:strand:- start:1384 stop:1683 length:300 start_codon:yes stop_codon:yes gene_type:complete
MAIKFAYTSSMGTTHDEAYGRIGNLTITRISADGISPLASGQVGIYASEEAARSGKKVLALYDFENIEIDKSGGNYISQSYSDLRADLSVGMFSGSIEV